MRGPSSADPCWLDGRELAAGEAGVPLTDPALHSGLGLFETLAVRDGAIFELDEHLARLADGARALGVPLPAARDLRRWIACAVAGTRRPAGWLKIVLTGGGRCILFGGSAEEAEGRAARAVLLPWRRSLHDPLAGFKTLNYAANQLGVGWARRQGADEGLWLNARGHLAEGCTSNLFIVEGRRVFTPGLRDGILPGVVRRRVVEAAKVLGLTVHEGKVRLRRLERACEAFLTSSLRGVGPLVEFQGRRLGDGQAGSTTRRLAHEVAGLRAATAVTGSRILETREEGESG